jgi:hypothetical protein
VPMNDNRRAVRIIMEAQGLAVVATEQGTSAVFPPTSDAIADGAAADGRNQVTNLDALAVLQAHKEFLEWSATPSKTTGKTPLQAFAKFAVNPRG